MSKQPHQSDSAVQGEAESLILAAAAVELGVDLTPKKISLPNGSTVHIDGVSDEPCILVEVYARQGLLKGGQPKKLAMDALKLMTVRQLVRPGARAVLALGSAEAAKHFVGKGWLGQALKAWDVEVLVVEIPDDTRRALIQAQERQKMVNPPAEVDE